MGSSETKTFRDMGPVKVILEVHAGIIPGESMEEYNRRWVLTREEYDANGDWILKEAADYARSLTDPSYVNWVRLEWVYL